MVKPKISVIVPIYNAEKYLHRCIDSILAQTFTDFEVLLINDGSKDSSGTICDEYALKDNRIRVFHKENGGVSSARNIGIKNMIGEYSIHVDSDDWIEPNMYEEMYKKASEEDADMVICDFKTISNHHTKTHSQRPIQLTPNALLIGLLESKLHGSPCNKLIKCSVIKLHNIQFKDDVSYCEDLLFNTEVLMFSESISHISRSFYHYMVNDQSLTSRLKLKPTLGFFSFLEYLKSNIINSKISIKYYYYQVLYVKSILFNSGFITMDTIKNYEKESNNYLSDLKHLKLYTRLSLNLIFMRLYFLASILRFLKYIYKNLSSK